MEQISNFVGYINGIVWGWPMLIAILGVGIFLTIGLAFMPIRKLAYAFSLMFKGREETDEPGSITPFQSLMTAMSATVGTGNIAGVATAVVLGGPGALFWMWMTALVGMATKYGEAFCAVKFREKDADGEYIGGPMYYIKNGLDKKWYFLAPLFAFFGAVAGFGIGNAIQANAVANVLEANFAFDKMITGFVLFALAGIVLLGGVKRIGKVAEFLVPFMAIGYIAIGLAVIFANIENFGSAISTILTMAFSFEAAGGGAAGMMILVAMRYGVARGVFSNEAGLGSAAIAHASAKTNDPVRQGMIGMLGTFIDTICVCSITGLAIVMSGVLGSTDASGELISGSALTSSAFAATFGDFGGKFVAIALAVFAFTTILGWSLYSERCIQFFFGEKGKLPFKIAWIVAIPSGIWLQSQFDLNFIWLVADTMNAFMALPNLIALALLSPVIFKYTKEYLSKL